MSTIYNLAVQITSFLLKGLALFNPKIKLFVSGRKSVFPLLRQHILKGDTTIWVHTASLGEFEQGLPLLERLRAQYPSHKLLVTFFSPSGYEVKKDTPAADLVTYLPLDTKKNAAAFLLMARPVLAIFVKYEIWPNYLRELKKQGIPTLLISSIFNKKQSFFRWYGGFMRKSLFAFSHIFVQDKNSAELLRSIHLGKVSIAGDTRLDRVSEIVERRNHLGFMDNFKGDGPCLVAGSTWPPDETVLLHHINTSQARLKCVIAPHNIKAAHIRALKASISKKTVLHSEMGNLDLADFDVLIVDTIGLLTKIYSYAEIAYVGGGFETGLHNTLEPAVFGIPVIIGPQYKGFKEAEDLVALEGILSITNGDQFKRTVDRLLENPSYRKETGAKNVHYINANKGASRKIMALVETFLVP